MWEGIEHPSTGSGHAENGAWSKERRARREVGRDGDIQKAASNWQKSEDSRLRLMASARQGDQPTQGSFSTKN